MNDFPGVEVVFFDARDTLGEVDRPGHLVAYRPTTQRLLESMRNAVGVRIGIITNLPGDVSAEQGQSMVRDAVLAEENGRMVRIGDFVDPDALIINHEVGFDKPDPHIYRAAADKVGVPVERCLYCSENLIEVLGARAAGMQSQLKPCPPGREFAAEPVKGLTPTKAFSGRAFEMVLEHEHLLGRRIFHCMDLINEHLGQMGEADPIPADLYAAMGILIYLTRHFVDAHHLRAEEAIIPLAGARGMDVSRVDWMFDHHDQARAYFEVLDVAWRRIERGERRDLPYAIDAFVRASAGFVKLFVWHGELEDDELFPQLGEHFSDSDDTLLLSIMRGIGPSDAAPYVSLVGAMEQALGTEPGS